MSYEEISLEDIHYLLTSATADIRQERPELMRHLHSVRTNFKIVHKKPEQYVYEYIDWSGSSIFGWGDHMTDLSRLMYKEWVVRR